MNFTALRFCIFSFFVFAGCINSRTILEPEHQPREEVGSAIIRTATPLLKNGYDLITIKRVDGKTPLYWEHKWVVTPGTHEIEVEVDLRKPAPGSDLTYVTKAQRTLTLYADPERTYVVDAQDDSRGLWIWVSDEETGVLVAGEAPPDRKR